MQLTRALGGSVASLWRSKPIIVVGRRTSGGVHKPQIQLSAKAVRERRSIGDPFQPRIGLQPVPSRALCLILLCRRWGTWQPVIGPSLWAWSVCRRAHVFAIPAFCPAKTFRPGGQSIALISKPQRPGVHSPGRSCCLRTSPYALSDRERPVLRCNRMHRASSARAMRSA
jgi:hypothetical protein